MQLIFLSGGSGKRLWPLSNNARSKQFLPLLEGPDGRIESMIQRVVRQTREAGINADITFATNAAQRDSIINQLGENVGIVAEPERRDTFPAIALACAYLSMGKHCPDDEVVVVLPSDPYTENGYFDTIRQMAHEVERNSAELVLMGITPTYPSAKYGYIVPDLTSSLPFEGRVGDGSIFAVRHFTEKPSEAHARELLSQHALWNGGVFAFRLGYLMAILSRYIHASRWEEVYNHYTDLPKISFDYEVAEKAANVAVVPFTGKWKDLGTWNTLTEELHHHAMGNVVLGDEMENSHVINELEVPVFCNGLRDIVVACSPDGVMVCRKDRTEDIKHYVDNLNLRPMYEERRWGTYKVLSDVAYQDGSRSLTKTIMLHPGKNISYQIHHHRDEVWTVVDGEGLFVLDGEQRTVQRGDVLVIRKEQWHAIRAVTPLTFIEVQLGCPLIEEDIERKEYNWL